MSTFRRDALGDNGLYRFIKTHCDGAFRTDAGPCGCGEPTEGCFVLLLPCCECPAALAYVADSPALEAVWPFETRGQGGVVRFGQQCYRYIAIVSRLPPSATIELSAQGFSGTFGDCADAACAGSECPPVVDGFGFFYQQVCRPSTQVLCVESARVVYSGQGLTRLSIFDPASQVFSWVARASYLHEAEQTGQFDFQGTFTGSSSGSYDTPVPVEWDHAQSYATGGLPNPGVNFSPVCAEYTPSPPPGVRECDVGFGADPVNHFGDWCNEPVRTRVLSGTETETTETSIVRIARSGLFSSVSAFFTSRTLRLSDGEVLRTVRSRRVKSGGYIGVRFATGVDTGDINTDTECEPQLGRVLAVPCSGVGEPITVDLGELPTTGDDFRALFDSGQGEELFIATTTPSEDDAAEVFWTLDACEPPASIWPVAVECGGTRTISYDPGAVGSGWATLLWEGVAYRKGPQMSTDAPVAATPSSEPCPGPGGVDGGSDVGGPSDADDVALIDPRTTAEAERQTAIRGAGGCSSC